MLDIKLLQIMKHKKDYEALVRTVPLNSVDPKTKALLEDFGKYFEKFKEHETIDLELFIPRFRQWHPALTEEQFATYKGMLRQLSQEADDCTRQGLLRDLYELSLGTVLANTIAKYDAGDLTMPLADVLTAQLDAYKINVGLQAVPWDDKSIEELLMEDLNEEGVKWRLGCLNNSMRPLRAGDFGIIAGRPDKGKTSFLSSELTFMADQIPEDRNVIWLNNEGVSGRVKKRLYQSALGLTVNQLLEKVKAGEDIAQQYADVVGRTDKIRVINIHGFHVGQVEAILEQSNPGIIVYDMIDNIKGFGVEGRNDLALEEMYKWARERCVKYSCIGLAASQISVEGEGEMYPNMSMLKDSKTGKQGACDFQLMIGASNAEGIKHCRYISVPKNKLRREDAPSDPYCEVVFKPNIARYEDLPHGS